MEKEVRWLCGGAGENTHPFLVAPGVQAAPHGEPWRSACHRICRELSLPHSFLPFALLTFLLKQRCLWDGAEEMKVMGMVGGHMFQSHMGLEKQC